MHRTESRLVTGPSNIMCTGMYVCVRVFTFQPENFTQLNLCTPKIGYRTIKYIVCRHVCACVYVCVCVGARVGVCALFSPNILHTGTAKGLNDDHKTLSSLFLLFLCKTTHSYSPQITAVEEGNRESTHTL